MNQLEYLSKIIDMTTDSMMPKSFSLVEVVDIQDSPVTEVKIASGRARCRICGEKIARGEREILFYASFTDGGSYNSWTSVECHAHYECGKIGIHA